MTFKDSDSNDGWYHALEKVLYRCENNFDLLEIAENIREWYGGMGSFNDTYLGETDEEYWKFVTLREEMYVACMEIITQARGIMVEESFFELELDIASKK